MLSRTQVQSHTPGGCIADRCSSSLRGLQTMTPTGLPPPPPTALQHWCRASTRATSAGTGARGANAVLRSLPSLASSPVVRAYQEEKPWHTSDRIRELPPAGEGHGRAWPPLGLPSRTRCAPRLVLDSVAEAWRGGHQLRQARGQAYWPSPGSMAHLPRPGEQPRLTNSIRRRTRAFGFKVVKMAHKSTRVDSVLLMLLGLSPSG